MADEKRGRGKKDKKDEGSKKGKKLTLEQSEQRVKLTWAIAHRIRRDILRALAASDGPRSPIQISRDSGAEINQIAYHAQILRDLGAMKLAEEHMARGAVEHFYASTIKADPVFGTLLEETRLADEQEGK